MGFWDSIKDGFDYVDPGLSAVINRDPKKIDPFHLVWGDNSKEDAATQAAVDSWAKINPKVKKTILQKGSSLRKYQNDPAAMAAQQRALQGLTDTVNAGGLDAQAMNDIHQQNQIENEQERGQREAVLANARARGVGGSGLEFASNLANQQGSATRGANQGFNTAALAEQRKAEALNDLARQGGDINNQNFSQAQAKASAQDAINQFNTLNQNNRLQQNKQNQFTQAGGKAAALQNQSGTFANQQKATQNAIGGIVGGVAAAFSDKDLKEDISQFDPENFLDSLTGYKYKYKDRNMGQGDQAGVLAQDLEKTKEGKAIVKDTPDGKVVDYGKGLGLLLASLAELHKEQKEIKERI